MIGISKAKQQFVEKTMELQEKNQHYELDFHSLGESLNQEVSKNTFLLQKI